MRRRKTGAGSMATTSCPSSFKAPGSPTGSKSPPTQRPRNPKPPPPEPSGHHQHSAIARPAPHYWYPPEHAKLLMPLADKIMLRKRFVIETVLDTLKSEMGLEHSRHRSPVN